MFENASQFIANNTNMPPKREDACKIFVGGLSWDTTRERLADYFCRFGQIVDCVLMLDTQTRRSRGFGFVTYTNPNAVYSVLANGPHILDGKMIDPKAAVPKMNYQNPLKPTSNITTITSTVVNYNFKKYSKIFVGGIGQATEEDLRKYFSAFGKVTEVSIIMDKLTGRPRGFAFVGFDDFKAAECTVSERYHSIRNKKVEVKEAQPRDVKMMENSMKDPSQYSTDDLMFSGLTINDSNVFDSMQINNVLLSPQIWKPAISSSHQNSVGNILTSSDGNPIVSPFGLSLRMDVDMINPSGREHTIYDDIDSNCSHNDYLMMEQNENHMPKKVMISRTHMEIPDSMEETEFAENRHFNSENNIKQYLSKSIPGHKSPYTSSSIDLINNFDSLGLTNGCSVVSQINGSHRSEDCLENNNTCKLKNSSFSNDFGGIVNDAGIRVSKNSNGYAPFNTLTALSDDSKDFKAQKCYSSFFNEISCSLPSAISTGSNYCNSEAKSSFQSCVSILNSSQNVTKNNFNQEYDYLKISNNHSTTITGQETQLDPTESSDNVYIPPELRNGIISLLSEIWKSS